MICVFIADATHIAGLLGLHYLGSDAPAHTAGAGDTGQLCFPTEASSVAHSGRNAHSAKLGPGAICLRAVASDAPLLTAGVLVLRRGVLNAPWRSAAWPDLFGRALSKREHARRANLLLRCISRVVVDPRFRGRGVGTALVRHALADAGTPLVECVASMAVFMPVFEAAGMQPVAHPEAKRNVALRESLRHYGIDQWQLLSGELATKLDALPAGERIIKRRRGGKDWAPLPVAGLPEAEVKVLLALRAALRVWAHGARATRGLADKPHVGDARDTPRPPSFALLLAASRGLAAKQALVWGDVAAARGVLTQAASSGGVQ